jgi:broad specificity phosphatase PhoE
MKPKAIFVRHAEAQGQNDKAKGQADLPLDAKGQKEAVKIGDRVAKYKPGVVFTSPLQRARIPAENIAQKSGAPLVILQKLKPWDFGQWTGKPKDQIEPKLKDLWRNHPNKPAPGGQSFDGAMDDARQAMVPVKHAIAAGVRPAVVWHSRQAREADNLLLGGPTKDPTTGGPDPGGIQLLKGKKLIQSTR